MTGEKDNGKIRVLGRIGTYGLRSTCRVLYPLSLTDICYPDTRRHALGSLSTGDFETRRATGREHFVCQESGVSQIFILIISHRETILGNVNVVV